MLAASLQLAAHSHDHPNDYAWAQDFQDAEFAHLMCLKMVGLGSEHQQAPFSVLCGHADTFSTFASTSPALISKAQLLEYL